MMSIMLMRLEMVMFLGLLLVSGRASGRSEPGGGRWNPAMGAVARHGVRGEREAMVARRPLAVERCKPQGLMKFIH